MLQNFVEDFKTWDIKKCTKSIWPIERVLKIKKEDKTSAKDPHPARETTPRLRDIPEIAVWCHLPRKTSQLTAEPEVWPEKWGNSEVYIFCMYHLVNWRLADTDAWCFRSLLYRIYCFCTCFWTSGVCRKSRDLGFVFTGLLGVSGLWEYRHVAWEL